MSVTHATRFISNDPDPVLFQSLEMKATAYALVSCEAIGRDGDAGNNLSLDATRDDPSVRVVDARRKEGKCF